MNALAQLPARAAVSQAVLRLFLQSDPFKQIDSRTLTAGELVIGRDPGPGGWTIADEERSVSRAHCVVALHNGRLTLRDTSSNGVFVGARRDRSPPGEATPIEPGDTLRLGGFLIVVEGVADETGGAYDAPFSGPMLKPVAVTEAALAVPSDWAGTDGAPAPSPSDGSLLDAFCAGARLDASAFSGEDPLEVMRRLGAVYQQMVLGLGDLMNERTSVKTEYRMTRTTVRAEGNNPFKWAPAQRVATDLLRPRGEGFLSGPAAVKASFEDMKKHLLCMMAGLRAAVSATLDGLAPEEAEARLKGQSMVLKNRDAMAFAEYQKLHAAFRAAAGDDPDSPVNLAFRAAYERQLQELDAMSTRA